MHHRPTNELRDLFGQLVELDARARAARLEELLALEPETAAQLQALLTEHDQPVDVLAFDKEDRPLLPWHKAERLPGRIGPYDVLAEIGRGGMGIVYRARQTHPDRDVAVKVLRPGLITETSERRFEREVQVMGLLDHPGIARVLGAGTCEIGFGPQPYFAMEFVDGQPLSVAVQSLSTDQSCELIARLADALHSAHAQGIVHRDVKPDNVLVTNPDGREVGQPVLLDFGIARRDASDGPSQTLTREGGVVGTLAYVSPEQLAAGLASPVADVYSLGAVLYEVLVGCLPLDVRETTLDQAIRVLQEKYPMPMHRIDRSVPRELDVIVQTAMAKEPEQRYASARALADDLRRFIAREPIHARPVTAWIRLRAFAVRHPSLAISIAALVAAILIGLTVSLWFAGAANRNAERAAQRGYAAESLAASRVLSTDAFAAMRSLDATEPRFRGFEWHLMQAMMDSAEQVHVVPEPRVHAAAYAANGHLLGAFAVGSTVVVRDFEVARDLFQRQAEEPVTGLQLSDDASLLAISRTTADGRLRLVVVPTSGGEPVFDRRLEYAGTTKFEFSRDKRYLTSFRAPKDQPCMILELANGKVWVPSPDWTGHRPHVDDYADTVTRGRRRRQIGVDRDLGEAKFSLLERRAKSGLVAGIDRSVLTAQLLDPETGEKRHIAGFASIVDHLTFCDEDKLLLAGSSTGGNIVVLDTDEWHVQHELHVRWSKSVPPAVHPTADRVVVCTERGIEEHPLRQSAHVMEQGDSLVGVAWSPDGALLAVTDWKGVTTLWNPDVGRRVGPELNFESPCPSALAFGRDGLSLIRVYSWSELRRLAIGSGAIQRLKRPALRMHAGDNVWRHVARGSRVSPGWVTSLDGGWLTQAAKIETRYKWSENGIELRRRSGEQPAWIGEMNADAWEARAQREARGRTRVANEVAKKIRHEGKGAIAVAFSLDSRYLAIGSMIGMVMTFDLQSGEWGRSIDAHVGPVNAVCFTNDGRLLTAGFDGVLRIWDPTSGDELAAIQLHDRAIGDIALSPDGTRVATALHDGVVRMWDTMPAWQRLARYEARVAEVGDVTEHVEKVLAAEDRDAALLEMWADASLPLAVRQIVRERVLDR